MRQVYYDPFGMRTEGYRAGVSDEQALQGSTRAARDLDWNYNNINPITLMGLRREEQYNQYADPFRRNAARGLDYDANLQRALGFGGRTGVFAPAQNIDFGYFQPNGTVPGGADGSSPLPYYTDPTGIMSFYNPDFNGYGDYWRMTDPSVSQYILNNANMEQAWRQFQAEQAMKDKWYQLGILQQQNNPGVAGGGLYYGQ